ncbi:MAG: hypothetical protein HYR60_09030 [Acidobacteria bacterium]|nr:hypothetical protein [Acidobacteriota bacterium]
MQENVAAALCYIAGLITGIIFLVLAPYNQNPTIRFHAFQSIFCNVAWIVLAIVLGIVTAALPLLLSPLALLFHLVMWLGGLAIWLLLMWKAYNGERFVLPVIGGLAQQQAGK